MGKGAIHVLQISEAPQRIRNWTEPLVVGKGFSCHLCGVRNARAGVKRKTLEQPIAKFTPVTLVGKSEAILGSANMVVSWQNREILAKSSPLLKLGGLLNQSSFPASPFQLAWSRLLMGKEFDSSTSADTAEQSGSNHNRGQIMVGLFCCCCCRQVVTWSSKDPPFLLVLKMRERRRMNLSSPDVPDFIALFKKKRGRGEEEETYICEM